MDECYAFPVVAATPIDILQELRASTMVDDDLQEIINQDSLPATFEVKDGLLFHDSRIVVPNDEPLRTRILTQHHDSPMAGHPGRDKMLELVQRQYTWPNLRRDVEEFVRGCGRCQRTKAPRHRPHGYLQPLPVPQHPWASISMDHITHLPPSSGFDAILVFVDRFSKMAHFIPCHTTDKASDLAQQFFSQVVSRHGFPNDIVSDRGATFTSSFWQQVLKQSKVTPLLSTAFHPQTNGQTERVNQTLEQYLRVYTDHLQSDWSSLLPTAELAYNNTSHSSTSQSPFYTVYGRHPRFDVTLSEPVNVPAAHEFGRHQAGVWEAAQACLQRAQARQKRNADRHRDDAPVFKVGDVVRLNRKNLSTIRPTAKLDDRFIGPMEIVEQINPVAFRLKLMEGMTIHDVFHVALLEHWSSNTFPSREPDRPPPVDVIHGQARYEVSQILNSRFFHQQLQYFISWTGYPEDENQWVSADDFDDDDELVLQFHKQYPHRPSYPQRLALAGAYRGSSGADLEGGDTVTAQPRRSSRLQFPTRSPSRFI